MSSSSLCLLALLLFLLSGCSNSQIPLGSQLSARENQTWVSANQTFAFGFTPAGLDDQFLLAIWYAELPGNATIVWSPNRDSPVSTNAVVRLRQSGDLALYDRNRLVWAANSSQLNVGFAVMSDSGSFVLYNSSGSNHQVAWQSFWLPGDTLLPGQTLSASLELTSNRSQFGYYTLKMLQHHMNLVTLCGFCSERTHRLLVYEYMSNGSLDKWIFPSYGRPDDHRLLDWLTRFEIAIAIAQGIAYFHEQCKNRIIHCDIKPENILLDDNFYLKVSDFGLAKLMSREHSHVVTMVRGTRGYLAPEWVSNRPITVKADVYSYGMLLLEIIGGRRNLDMSLDSDMFYYPGWAFKELTDGTPLNAADRRLKGKVEEDALVRALNAAFWCIQEEAWVRPSMGEVVVKLSN